MGAPRTGGENVPYSGGKTDNQRMDEIQQLQKQGAEARALGRSRSDNPFYQPALMPSTTGDSVPDWCAKVDAWELGWKIEDAMRPDQLSQVMAALARI